MEAAFASDGTNLGTYIGDRAIKGYIAVIPLPNVYRNFGKDLRFWKITVNLTEVLLLRMFPPEARCILQSIP